jgi:hypothetical protein
LYVNAVRIYSDADGESHFEDIELDLVPLSVGELRTSSTENWPASTVQFRQVDDDFESGFHTAPKRRVVINLAGFSELEVSSGERRIVGPGIVQLVEDTSGRGHKAAKTTGQPLQMLIIGLD